jgi:HAD superfamily hydrolase (TIGR01450 family)
MYIEKFLSYGVTIQPNQIITSAMATAYLLKKKFPSGGPVFIAGEAGLIHTLADAGFFHAVENVLAVVVGLDRALTYEKLSDATLLINNGALFIGTNPDPSYPTPRGLQPGAGAMIGFVAIATGVQPQYAGKPAPVMINMALENLKLTPQEVLVVGDRLDTDILTGQNAGCRTALVLTGVTTREDLKKWPQSPDMVCENVTSFVETLLGSK